MGWMPSCPQDPGVYHGTLNPQAIVLHRTYGAWGGDYSVGKQGIFHFLLGKEYGHWVQFAPTEIVQWHCNGANFRAFGIEVEGTNEEVLTDWQSVCLGSILRWANNEHGIPLNNYQDPYNTPLASISVNHTDFRGVISHISVMTDDGSSQHTDFITPADYRKALGFNTSPTLNKKDDDMVVLESDGLYLLSGGVICGIPTAGDAVALAKATLPGTTVKVTKGCTDLFKQYFVAK